MSLAPNVSPNAADAGDASVGWSFPASSRPISEQERILNNFAPELQVAIKERLKILQSWGRYLSKDFTIPIELNEPGQGWHWNFAKNVIRVDPIDLLQHPIEHNQFVIAHEAAHRRISRFHMIPKSLWQELGYSFMTNAIEDARINNFIASLYPSLSDSLRLVYEGALALKSESSGRAIRELGHEPKFITAGFAYLEVWFSWWEGEKPSLDRSLPPEVLTCLEKTLGPAEGSWRLFPAHRDDERGEAGIVPYATRSFEINRDLIWPEFKKLVEQDLANQELQEILKQFQQQNGEIPEELEDTLDDRQRSELSSALADSKERSERESGGAAPSAVPLDSLSDELKEKLREYFDRLPESLRESLTKAAEEELKRFEGQLTDDLQKIAEQAQSGDGDGAMQQSKGSPGNPSKDNSSKGQPDNSPPQKPDASLAPYEKAEIEPLEPDLNRYRTTKLAMRPLIQSLTGALQKIFRDRKMSESEPQYRSGNKVSIPTRIRELASDTPAPKSHAWHRNGPSKDLDYAITILVDLTGSMSRDKIAEAFKALVTVAESLERLGIDLEILGFNSSLYIGKSFKEELDINTRGRIGAFVNATNGPGSWNTDDGWAIAVASDRLSRRRAKNKFMIVLTDGQSNPSVMHSQPEYKLANVIRYIRQRTDQVLVAVGIGPGTGWVASEYPNGAANVPLDRLPTTLVQLIQDIVRNYDKFKH